MSKEVSGRVQNCVMGERNQWVGFRFLPHLSSVLSFTIIKSSLSASSVRSLNTSHKWANLLDILSLIAVSLGIEPLRKARKLLRRVKHLRRLKPLRIAVRRFNGIFDNREEMIFYG